MNIRIKETGVVESLEILDSKGVEWTQDLIGNAGEVANGNFAWSEDDNLYVALQEVFDWWKKYIEDATKTESEIDALSDLISLSRQEILQMVEQSTTDDYEQHRRQAINTLNDLRRRYASSLLGSVGTDAKAAAARRNGRKGGRPRKVESAPK